MQAADPIAPEWMAAPEHLVVDPAAIEVLWHPAKRLHLKPFIGKCADLAAAAAELGIRKPAMSYWIDRLLEVGLIRQTHVEKRLRHRVPFYRCVADHLRVGLVDAPLASYDDVFDEFQRRWATHSRQALAEALARQAPHLELHIRPGGAAGLATSILPRPGAVPQDDFIYYWARLWLTADENRQLRDELDALWEKYAALSDESGKPEQVVMHLLQAPESWRTPINKAGRG